MMAALQRASLRRKASDKARRKTIPGMFLNASALCAAGETLLAIEDRASKDARVSVERGGVQNGSTSAGAAQPPPWENKDVS